MLSRLKFYLRFTLGMTRQEIRGIYFMLGLIVFGMGVHWVYQYLVLEHEAEMIEPQRFDEVYVAQKVLQKKSTYAQKSYPIYKRFVPFKAFPKKSQDWKININEADSLAWVALPGIGPGFAKRILSFRERLGGFAFAKQLTEVYGIDTIWVKQHVRQFQVGKGVYRFLYVNRAIWSEFRHPYLPYSQAKVVLSYRKQHGVIADFKALLDIKLVDSLAWKRLRPYLNFEP